MCLDSEFMATIGIILEGSCAMLGIELLRGLGSPRKGGGRVVVKGEDGEEALLMLQAKQLAHKKFSDYSEIVDRKLQYSRLYMYSICAVLLLYVCLCAGIRMHTNTRTSLVLW